MTAIVESVDQLKSLVGTELGTSRWFEIPQASIDRFAVLTQDEQWIHVDPERSAAGPFGGPIAHGYLVLSHCSAMIADVLAVVFSETAINYGLDRTRFMSPVPAGAAIRGRIELAAAKDVPGGVQAVLRVTVEVNGGDKPACVADAVIRYLGARG